MPLSSRSSSDRPPANRMMATAAETMPKSGLLFAKKRAGSKMPRPAGLIAKPKSSSSRMEGMCTRHASHWASIPRHTTPATATRGWSRIYWANSALPICAYILMTL